MMVDYIRMYINTRGVSLPLYVRMYFCPVFIYYSVPYLSITIAVPLHMGH